MSALEARGTHFVARIRNNAVLKRLAVPAIDALASEAAGPPGGQRPPPHLELRAGRGVPRWLLVAWPARRPDPGGAPGIALPPCHVASGRRDVRRGAARDVPAARQGGEPHGRADERRRAGAVVVAQAQEPLYRGRPVRKRGWGTDAFANNEARLLLALFGYQIMHTQRAVLERATGTGWALRRVLERVLRAPARFTVSGRRITIDHGRGRAALAPVLLRHLDHLAEPAGQPRRHPARPTPLRFGPPDAAEVSSALVNPPVRHCPRAAPRTSGPRSVTRSLLFAGRLPAPQPAPDLSIR